MPLTSAASPTAEGIWPGRMPEPLCPARNLRLPDGRSAGGVRLPSRSPVKASGGRQRTTSVAETGRRLCDTGDTGDRLWRDLGGLVTITAGTTSSSEAEAGAVAQAQQGPVAPPAGEPACGHEGGSRPGRRRRHLRQRAVAAPGPLCAAASGPPCPRGCAFCARPRSGSPSGTAARAGRARRIRHVGRGRPPGRSQDDQRRRPRPRAQRHGRAGGQHPAVQRQRGQRTPGDAVREGGRLLRRRAPRHRPRPAHPRRRRAGRPH